MTQLTLNDAEITSVMNALDLAKTSAERAQKSAKTKAIQDAHRIHAIELEKLIHKLDAK